MLCLTIHEVTRDCGAAGEQTTGAVVAAQVRLAFPQDPQVRRNSWEERGRMRCPFCNADDDKVIDSRATDGGRCTRRRRQCLACNRRYTTYERVEDKVKLSVIKRDESRVPYDRDKIREAIRQAAYKRPISSERIDRVVDEVEEGLVTSFDKEVSSQTIGERIASALRRVDKVAYVGNSRTSVSLSRRHRN
jgi:transcriptional repressor NrdR